MNSVLVSVTEACHVGCHHCGFIGASRDREADPAEMVVWVEQICAYGVQMVIFTGGEAFERFDVLKAGVLVAHRHSVPVGIFTSSYWATSVVEAKEILAQLPGTYRLYLSTDVYHQRTVPYQNVRNAIEAAVALNIPRISLIVTYATDEDCAAVTAEYEKYLKHVEIFADRVIPNPNVSPRVLSRQDPLKNFSPDAYSSRCWLSTPMLNPNGDLFTCHIGKAGAHKDLSDLPYFLGSLRKQTFEQVMNEARVRPDYQFLRTHGPKGVAEIVQTSPALAHMLRHSQYTNDCHMCISVLKTPEGTQALRTHAKGATDVIDLRLQLLLNEKPAFS